MKNKFPKTFAVTKFSICLIFIKNNKKKMQTKKLIFRFCIIRNTKTKGFQEKPELLELKKFSLKLKFGIKF